MKCIKCGKENWEDAKFCEFCGNKLNESEKKEVINDEMITQENNNNEKRNVKKRIILAVIIVLVIVFFGVIIGKSIYNEFYYKKLPIEVNISMNSYEGNIDYILLELGLDFDDVTKGANCYSGVVKGDFSTEKYGLLHTEFRYCNFSETLNFRVYNSTLDQKTRKPTEDEVVLFDKYGNPDYSSNYNKGSGNSFNFETNDNNNDNNTTTNDNNDNDTNNSKKTIGFDETFTFDGLEITIGSNYTFTTVKNQFSDYYNKSVIKIPVTVKNVSGETNGLNSFDYKLFGPSGIELDRVYYYFDNSVDETGDLKNNTSYTKYFYILYDGDGTYSIEFDNYSEEKEVEFNITK